MLPADRWPMMERIFHKATALPAERRRSFVEKRCGRLRNLAMQIAADWAGDLSPMLVGNAVDGYQVRAMLGAGGMGET
jgi:hypothetical protein